MAFDHLGEDLVVHEARRTRARAERVLRAVCDDVVAELAVGALDRAVGLADGRVEAAVVHVELEQLDHAFDRAVDIGLVRDGDLAVGDGVDRAARQLVDELVDDLRRLLDLLEAHEVAREAAARARDRDRELHALGALAVPVVGEAEVRIVLAEVAAHARAARVRAREAPLERVFLRDRADAVEAVDEDAVAVAEGLEVGDRLREADIDEVPHHPLEGLVVGDVAPRAADARPVGVVALARDVLDDVVDELALVEPVEEACERAEVERRGADAQEVVLDAAELAHDGAHDLGARGELDAEELLDRVVPRDVVHDRRDVVHPADRADILVVVVVLAELLEARMQVPDVRRAAGDALAVELEHEPEGRVGRRVLRTEVQDPAIGGLEVVLEVVRVLDIKAEAFAGGNGVRHRAESIRPSAARCGA